MSHARVFSFFALVVVSLSSAACSSSSSSSTGEGEGAKCKADTECTGASGKPLCDVTAGACVALPPGNAIGYRDGSAGSVTFTEMGAFPASMKPVDLGFHPERTDELWVVGYGDDSVQVGTGIGGDAPSWKRYLDPAARHFMHKPPAMAMGIGNTWATCGDNDNGQNAESSDGMANLFMGPALFTADLAVFAKRVTGLGSHLDMLHASPLCRGIAHVDGNWYWVFNAYDRSLDKYNFGKDHGPGNDDHSDGEIYRYAKGKVKGATDGTPSHLVFDPEDGFLYVADTGNARVVRLDTARGTKGGDLERYNEPLKASAVMQGTDVEEVIAPGVLEKPSGIEIRGGLLYVTDAATSTFYVFDKTGNELRRLATDLPAGSLAGFTFGAEGKIYFTDKTGGRVVRIDPQ